jgi:hypothetical protein
MSFRWLACAVVLAGFYTTPVPSQPSQDTVTLNDDAGEENGIIFWGSETDHKVFTGPSANIPDIDRGTANQLVAFTKGRAPALDDDVAWSSGHDGVSIGYLDPLRNSIARNGTPSASSTS